MKARLVQVGTLLSVLGWMAVEVYTMLREAIEDNQDSINALIGLHLK